jgi:endonuclease-3 related protein
LNQLDLPAEPLRRIFDQLLATYGPQHWWPAESPFEVMLGAVLTQNTAWGNVEKAISGLKEADLLSLDALLKADVEEMAASIRPAGYFNLKTQRLLALCRFLDEQGGERALRQWETPRLRQALLAVKGVGPETADDILLYAFQRPVFVIDTYSRRLFARQGLCRGDEPYEVLRIALEQALKADHAYYNEYHALIVRHAKEACRKQPQCEGCCLSCKEMLL